MSLISVDLISNYSGFACGAVAIYNNLRPVIVCTNQYESPIPKLYYRCTHLIHTSMACVQLGHVDELCVVSKSLVDKRFLHQTHGVGVGLPVISLFSWLLF